MSTLFTTAATIITVCVCVYLQTKWRWDGNKDDSWLLGSG